MSEKPEEITDPCIVPATWNIYQRVNWVRSKISYVQKDATVQNQYTAVRHDAVTAHLRPFLIQAGIVTTETKKEARTLDSGTTTKNGIPIIRYECDYLIGIVNAASPEDKIEVLIEAHACDQGDKAPGKSMSYAIKYAYLKIFALETGEDEESRVEQKAQAEIEAEKEAWRLEKLNRAIDRHMDSIQAIKQGIKEDDLSTAAEAWFELSNEEKADIWVAPGKGGPFSTAERKVIKSTEFREAHYGPEKDMVTGKDLLE